MTELATFAAVLNSLKVAADIAKTLKESDLSLERAEMKMKIAELLSAVADAKIATSELQTALQEKNQEIKRLTEALATKAEVVKDGDAYFRKGPDGKAQGEPFCLHCWESRKELSHLIRGDRREKLCPACKTSYDDFSIPHHEQTG